MDNSTKEKIVKEYLDGKTIKEISILLNIPKGTVRYNLVKSGIKPRPRKGMKYHIDKTRVPLEVVTSKEGTPDFDYFIGILATDGNIHKSKVSIQFSPENSEILNYWKEFLNNKVNIKSFTRRSDGRTYYEVSFKSQPIADYFSTFGITERKTFTLKLSYLNWNVIRGIFDGDGCLTVDKRTMSSWQFAICSASINFIYQLNDFFVENGLHPIVTKEKNYYNIIIERLSELYYIYTNIYKDSSYFLRRKYEKFWPLIKKFISKHSVNSVKGRGYHKTEPSPLWEGAETRNGEPK